LRIGKEARGRQCEDEKHEGRRGTTGTATKDMIFAQGALTSPESEWAVKDSL
jgi:hypothetical protein